MVKPNCLMSWRSRVRSPSAEIISLMCRGNQKKTRLKKTLKEHNGGEFFVKTYRAFSAFLSRMNSSKGVISLPENKLKTIIDMIHKFIQK